MRTLTAIAVTYVLASGAGGCAFDPPRPETLAVDVPARSVADAGGEVQIQSPVLSQERAHTRLSFPIVAIADAPLDWSALGVQVTLTTGETVGRGVVAQPSLIGYARSWSGHLTFDVVPPFSLASVARIELSFRGGTKVFQYARADGDGPLVKIGPPRKRVS